MQSVFNLPENNKKRIIIIGAGFAGLKLARSLVGSPYQVVVIDKRNFHQFQPLFYQVASSGIEPSSISFPIRKAFQQHPNLHFRNLELISIHAVENKITTDAGDIAYDYLVIASGVNTNYFGNENIAQNSIPMKSTSEAIYLRNKILASFEKAILTEDKSAHDSILSMSIVGGGPTGVELAGALAELRNHTLPKDYPELDFSRMKIRLFEAGPRLLAGMSETSSQRALKFLQKLEVDVNLNTLILDYNNDEIVLKDKKIKCNNLIWAAGVSGKTIDGFESDDYTRGNRLKVNRQNKLINHSNIYAIGDISSMVTPKYPNGHPQVAQVAIQQAKLLAKNFVKQQEKEFEYHDKGSMATIGRNMAVVDLPRIKFSGTLAWFMWLFVHLMAIVGVKNRLFIFINWAQSYFSKDQSLRILIKPIDRK